MATKRITLTGSPLSTNHIYRRARYGGMYMTTEGKALKEKWAWEAKSQWKLPIIKATSISLSALIFWGDKRKRDLDNANKLMIDSLTGIVYEDDKLIDELIVRREYDKKNPRVEVVIATL